MPVPSPTITTSLLPSSGPVLGGIGTGGIELWPDGSFRRPLFTNPRPFAQGFMHPLAPGAVTSDEPPFALDDLFFVLRVKESGKAPVLRFLAVGNGTAFLSWNHMDRGYRLAGIPMMQAIEHTAAFPQVELRYRDDRLPVEVTLSAWSPFVPHDVEASSIPGACFDFSVRRVRGRAPIEVSIVACCSNLAGWDQTDHAQAHTRIRAGGDVILRMQGGQGEHPSTGTMAVFAQPTGTQRCTSVAANPWLENLRLSIDRTGGLDGPIEPKRLTREEYRTGPLGSDLASGRLGGDGQHRNRAWACLQTTLTTADPTAFHFGLAWHFPHHIDRLGHEVGHAYAERFSDAAAVAKHLLKHGDDLRLRSLALPGLIRASTLPDALKYPLLDHLGVLVRSSWLTRAGTLYVWEGLGHCAMNTVDVDHYGSFASALLFPDLRRGVTDLIASGQRPNGHIPHGFPGHVRVADIPEGEYQRWDVNAQFILALHRDWRWTGDATLLDARYGNAVQALDRLRGGIRPGEALPWIDGGITYDHWHLSGVVTYMAILHLAALQAMVVMAQARGDAALAQRCRDEWEAGRQQAEQQLWSTSGYRPLARTAAATDGGKPVQRARAAGAELYAAVYGVTGTGERLPIEDGLHTDALNGEAYARLTGLPTALSPKRVRQTLARIVGECTHHDGRFLANGSCPDGSFPDEWPYSQWQNPWTGTEYFLAAQLAGEGMVREADEVLEHVWARKHDDGMRFNHNEAGDYYSRTMAIWATWWARLGLDRDAVRGSLAIVPPDWSSITRLDAPIVIPGAMLRAVLERRPGATTLDLTPVSGALPLRELTLPGAATGVRVRQGARRLAATIERSDGITRIRFAKPIALSGKRGIRVQLTVTRRR